MESENYMVSVRDAYKKFIGSPHYVLQGINISVRKGAIYSLLGPSGCGKTTLLGTITGRKKLDFGIIKLDITQIKQLGYMPQETALFQELTVEETFYFYGYLYGMKIDEIERKYNELKLVLDLPEKKRMIKTLSGGQQRRISFGVSVVHDPDLIILDEPTVGLDTLIRESVWNYMFDLSRRHGKTIIITTHYIEEAKQSDMAAIMRNGQILLEDEPIKSVRENNVETMEDLFLKICLSIDKLNRSEDSFETDDNKLKQLTKSLEKNYRVSLKSELISSSRILAQLMKNIRWCQRSMIVMLLIVLIWPFVLPLCFCIGYGRFTRDIPIAVISDEMNYRECGDSFSFETETVSCSLNQSLTCGYVEELNKVFTVILYNDSESAEKDIRRNLVWGMIRLSDNWTEAIISRISDGIFIEPININKSEIEINLDMASYPIGYYMKRKMAKQFKNTILRNRESCQIPKEVITAPLRFNEPIYGLDDPEFDSSGISNLLCGLGFFLTVSYSSGLFFSEKCAGIKERVTTAGVTYMELLIAHSIIQFIIMLIQSGIMYLTTFVLFSIPFPGSIISAGMILFSIEICGMTFGIFLAEILNSDSTLIYAIVSTTFAEFVLTGIIWPIEGAPYFIQVAALVFPSTSAFKSFTYVLMKNSTYAYFPVYIGILSTILWCIIFILSSVYLNKFKSSALH